MNLNNMMHLAVTAAIVILTIASFFAIGLSLLKTNHFKAIGGFTWLCGMVIVSTGIATPIFMSEGIPVVGLVERINIFTLQLWVFVSSIFLYKIRLPKKAELVLKRVGLLDIYEKTDK